MKDFFKQPIDLIFSQNGICSKRAAKNFIKSNRIFVNDKYLDFENGGHKILIDIARDKIFINGDEQHFLPNFYFMMNKPLDVVCSTVSDSHKTVFDIIEENVKNRSIVFDENLKNNLKNFCTGYDENQFLDTIENFYKTIQIEKIKCVGRLDCDTSGLLLFSTNGTFVDKITRPENKIKKTYFVKLRDTVSDEKKIEYSAKIKHGFFLPAEKKSKSFTTEPGIIKWLSDDTLELSITEGHFHEVRRIFLALENFVQELKRIKIENLELDNFLLEGQMKFLPTEFVESIFRQI